MKTWAKWTIGIVAVIIVLGIIGSLFSAPETEYLTGNVVDEKASPSNKEESSSKTTEKIKILDHKMEYGEFGNLMVVGTAENVANRQLSYVEIDVKFYDEGGVLIEGFLDNINDLDAGEKWKFEVMYPGMDTYEVDSYKISVGTVW